MAKNMAQIEGGVVVNILWCSGDEPETDTLKDLQDRPVIIGDTYTGGRWYRNGAEILTSLEEAQAKIADMSAALKLLGVAE